MNAKQRLKDQVYRSVWVPDLICGFVHAKQRAYQQTYKSLWVPALICCFFTQNSVISTRITSLNGSQNSSIDFCKQTACLAPKLHASMGPRPHLWICPCKTETWGPEWQVSMGPTPNLSFCAFITAWLSPELLVSMGPSPHLRFCAFKTATYNQNYKSVWVPAFNCGFVHSKQRI